MAGKKNQGILNNEIVNPQVSVEQSQDLFYDPEHQPGSLQLINSYSPYKNHLASDLDLYQSGYFHIFMTKPDLNLMTDAFDATVDTSISGTPTKLNGFEVLKMKYLKGGLAIQSLLCNSLTTGIYDNSPFIKPVTNLSHNAPLTDTTLRVYEAYENFSGYRMPMGKGTKESRNAQQFQIRFHDTDNLLLMNTHRIWMEYIDKCKKGLIVRSQFNVQSNIIDYMQTLYVFGLKPDGRTINYWARYTGIFPVGIPWTGLNMEQGQFAIPTFDVQYSFLYRQEMHDQIIDDFTYIAGTGPANKNDFAYEEKSFRDGIYPTRGSVYIDRDITGNLQLIFTD